MFCGAAEVLAESAVCMGPLPTQVLAGVHIQCLNYHCCEADSAMQGYQSWWSYPYQVIEGCPARTRAPQAAMTTSTP